MTYPLFKAPPLVYMLLTALCASGAGAAFEPSLWGVLLVMVVALAAGVGGVWVGAGLAGAALLVVMVATGAEPRPLTVVQGAALAGAAFGAARLRAHWREQATTIQDLQGALRTTQQNFRAALQGAAVVAFLQDRDLRYTWIYNPAASFDPDTIVGKRDSDLLEDQEHAALLTRIKQSVLDTGEPRREEVTLLHPDGVARAYELAVHPLHDTTGAVSGIAATSIDITHRKQFERTLRENEERLRVAIKNSALTVYQLDRDLTVTWLANAQVKVAETMVGKHIRQALTDPIQREQSLQMYRDVLESGEGRRAEIRRTLDGRDTYWDIIVEPLRDTDGIITGLTIAALDITPRKRAELEQAVLLDTIQAERDKLQSVLESINEEVWFIDTAGKLTLLNELALTGLDLGPIDPKHLNDVLNALEIRNTDGELRTADQAPLFRALEGEVIVGHEEIVRHPGTGKTIYREANAAPLHDKHGSITGAVATVHEITDRKMVELQREKMLAQEKELRQLAEEADQFKTQFLAMVSHDLRTPLALIMGFAESLLAEDVEWTDEEIRSYMHIIHDASHRLNDLIEQLLTITRLQAGTMPVKPEPTTLSTILKASQVTLEQLTADHTLEVTLPTDLPPIMADENRIAQVLINLVSNAAKYSPEGSPIRLMAAHTDEGAVTICLRDHGTGIPAEERPTIFDAFERSSLTAEQAGIGLGLAICKGFVEAHHGHIWIEDPPEGPGTVFCFTLPLA